jgi:putative transcriptional regulator
MLLKPKATVTSSSIFSANAILGLAILYFLGSFQQCAAAQPNTSLAPGVFLVATENLNGSSFEKTVVLLTQYNKSGAFGLAINRPSNALLSDVFPSIDSNSTDALLYMGGPVHPSAMFVIANSNFTDSMIPVLNNVYFSTEVEVMTFILKNNIPSKTFRAYSGYSGWSAGQLEAEIERGDWLIVKGDEKIIFDSTPSRVWKKLIQAWSGQWI